MCIIRGRGSPASHGVLSQLHNKPFPATPKRLEIACVFL